MNNVDIIIIGVALVSILVVIAIIARSFKNVDKEILESIEKNNNISKRKIWGGIKQKAINFVEWLLRIIRKTIKKIHFWVIREKNKSKNEVIKAKDEFVIDNKANKKAKNTKRIKIKEKNKKNNKNKMEGDILSVISEEDSGIVIDSVAQDTPINKGKVNFIKGLFKTKAKKKKTVDIKEPNTKTVWTLNEENDKMVELVNSNGVKFQNNNSNATDDITLGIDRKILEKKILQRIDKDPRNINNYHELGELYIKMKKYDDAMEVFGYILSVSPEDREAKRRQDKIKLLQKV